MTDDIEKKLYEAADSVKMRGFGDRLERIVSDTERSAGIYGARALTDEELDLVAGGRKTFSGVDLLPNDASVENGSPIRTGIAPKGGLQC